ncbi:super-infection exclusion protein B [Paraburkholderia pallida]|uniref:super-infection exclusion protein B n=1 Tax=Paraburkholderia pallida TaxID=2547399 RepID=UPI001E49081F|nr:super-infection exclusion protein B [Paraburkholderia pallida]
MGMIADIAEGKAAGQIAVKPLLAIAIASGALLHAPSHFVGSTGLTDFLAKYRIWIGFALLASCAYLVAQGLSWFFSDHRIAVGGCADAEGPT